ncbi:MAG: hypothetical protein ACXACA_00730 [Candidatus Ranarchaeia archaeon]
MKGQAINIAKAEFYIQTSSFRKHRKTVTLALYAFGVVWALVIVPTLMSFLIETFASVITPLLMVGLPGFMRSGVLMLWVFLMVFPMSLALKEIKIGQWEIMLSNGVNTKSIMFGTFAGKIPSYGLLVLYFSPLLLSPFAYVFQVSLLGQSLMYLALFSISVSTLWLGELITTAIQSKLGESPRGNDIANALTWVLALVIVIPMYGLMFFAGPVTEILGMNIFLVFPFTWGADLISWIAILFNGIGFTPQQIAVFQLVLQLDIVFTTIFFGGFVVAIVGIAFMLADRFFSFEAGARTERIITVGAENVFIRTIRKLAPGPFGLRLVTTLKDFGRKAQNLSGLAYGVIIALILPFLMTTAFDTSLEPGMDPFLLMIGGIMLAAMTGIAFGGIGFMDSKDQLWIIRSAPNGVKKYIKARVSQGFLFAIPLVLLTSTITSIILNLSLEMTILMVIQSYTAVAAAVLIGVGVTAGNPDYEDTKSPNFKANTMTISMTVTMTGTFSIMIPIFADIFGFEIGRILMQNDLFIIFLPSIILTIIGIVFLYSGAKSLANTEY